MIKNMWLFSIYLEKYNILFLISGFLNILIVLLLKFTFLKNKLKAFTKDLVKYVWFKYYKDQFESL